jgi:uncharacterized protein (DUF58 family)
MITNRSIGLLSIFLVVLVLGLLFGNMILIGASLIPLVMFLLGLLVRPPGDITVESAAVKPRAWIGDEIEIIHQVTVKSGIGPVTVFQELPSHFAIVRGDNLRVFWKGWHDCHFTFSYSLRCTKRGVYVFPQLEWQGKHAFNLMQSRGGKLGLPVEVVVRPKLPNVRRIRGLPGVASSPFPVIDVAKIGVTTTDFREIRSYTYGDPIKNINWKATARKPDFEVKPLVNDYEVEGKKAVWLFLDSSSELEVGSSVENCFEYCLEAANGIAYYFLDRGYRTGLFVYNGNDQFLYPDAGKKQYTRILREIVRLKPQNRLNGLPSAVEKCRSYIQGYNPLCVIVTRLDSHLAKNVIDGVMVLRRFRGRRRRKLPVMVVSVDAYNIIERVEEYDENAAMLMHLETRPRIQQLRRLGASVLEWNPRREGIASALLREAKRR